MDDDKKKDEELEIEDDKTTENPDEGGKEKSKGTGADSSKKDDKKKDRTFTQDQVNRMMTREKNQGKAAAYKELGIDPSNTRMVKMFQAFIESQKTDEQKELEKDIEAKEKQKEAERRVIMAEAKAEAMMLGVKSQYVEDAVTLALSKIKDDNTDLKTILTELKEKYAVWFEESEDDDDDKGKDKQKTGKKGTGASIKEKGKKTGKEESGSLGSRLAAQRRGTPVKKSWWGSDVN